MSPTTSQISEIFTKLAQERHSGRSYDAEKPVAPELLSILLEAARWAPSSYGEEPWRFIICEKQPGGASSAYVSVLNALMEGNKKWAGVAPILIVVVASKHLARDRSLNRWAIYDTGAAAQNMMLAAQANGLMLHSMGGFDPTALRKAFSISEDFEIMAVMALGYEISTPASGKRERAPRETRFFFNKWGG